MVRFIFPLWCAEMHLSYFVTDQLQIYSTFPSRFIDKEPPKKKCQSRTNFMPVHSNFEFHWMLYQFSLVKKQAQLETFILLRVRIANYKKTNSFQVSLSFQVFTFLFIFGQFSTKSHLDCGLKRIIFSFWKIVANKSVGKMESFSSDVQAILMELNESERQADDLISVNFVISKWFCQFKKCSKSISSYLLEWKKKNNSMAHNCAHWQMSKHHYNGCHSFKCLWCQLFRKWCKFLCFLIRLHSGLQKSLR